jgi:hypothetical protein
MVSIAYYHEFGPKAPDIIDNSGYWARQKGAAKGFHRF